MNTAEAVALIADVGAWGLGAIGGVIFLAARALGRTRLVAPPKVPAILEAAPAAVGSDPAASKT